MKVAELKASIRMHNQAYAIRGYSHMNKGSLVDALAKQDRNSFCTLSIMVNAHNKSRDELKVMKVAELKTLVRKHNLDNAIRRYSKMKKSELVDALMKHSTSDKPAAKPAPKPAAKKPKPEVVEEKKETPAERAARRAKPRVIRGPIPIGKNPELSAFSAKVAKDKAERRALERNDPAAYEAKMNAIHAAQQLPSQSELFDMKKKAARQKKPAAKKPAAKKPAAKPAATKPAAKTQIQALNERLQLSVSFLENVIEQYLGDFEKLKQIIFDQRRKVKGEDKEFLSDTVDRLNSIIDKYAPQNASIKATVNTGLKQPTLKELGLSGAVPDKDWVKKTGAVVGAFIKANEKTMGQEIRKQKKRILELKVDKKVSKTKKAVEKGDK